MTQENPPGRYAILRELGRGAIGTVCAARDRSTGATVALRTLDPALLGAADAKLAALFLENARSAARLRHQNIVKVHDAGEAGGTAYVAMDLVEGESLRRMLEERRPLPIARAVQIFDDIASALAYAHEEGIVHRGVRPSNIFVSRSGVAKIGDFGIGQIGEAALPYMSPEQVRGDPVDQRSDLFSLGAVFYEMLTGRAPFAGSSPKEIRESILRAEAPKPSEANPHVPGALDAMVSSLLAARPEDRPANARSLLRDLQGMEEALGLRPGASEPAASVPPSRPEPRLRTLELPDFHDARPMRYREPEPQPRSGSRTAILAVLALLLAALSIGLTAFSHYSPNLGDLRTLAGRFQEAPATAAAPSPPAAPPPAAADARPEESPPIGSAPDPLPSKPAAVEPSPSAQTESLPAAEPEQPSAGRNAPPRQAPQVAQATNDTPKPQAGGTAKLIIAVSPQGEIYIDGAHHGTTPPITTLDLEPGMHRIEIRSGSRKPYLTYMTVQPGDQRRIRHDFAAPRIRPPA